MSEILDSELSDTVVKLDTELSVESEDTELIDSDVKLLEDIGHL